MKKIFSFILLTTVSVVFANPSYHGTNCPVSNSANCFYQQSDESNQNSQQQESDRDITIKIYAALNASWFSSRFENVSFDVNNRNVSLEGSVDTLEDKTKAEDYVTKIDGVKHVYNNIEVNQESLKVFSNSQLKKSENKYRLDFAFSSNDRQINAKIRDKLKGGFFSRGHQKLGIKTTNGNVVLNGMVHRYRDMKKIMAQIKNIEGVKSINNQLTAKHK